MFTSLNPYESLEVVIADSPQELVLALKRIQTQIKIVQIVPVGTRQAAYIMGDIRINQIKPKGVKNGSKNSSGA
jgi:hypothetical protein